jgi:hypothetical protein
MQVLRRVIPGLRTVYIVAKRPPPLSFPIVLRMIGIQRVLTELPPVDLDQVQIRQDLPSLWKGPRASGQLDFPRYLLCPLTWVPQQIGSLVHIPVRQRRSGVSGAL